MTKKRALATQQQVYRSVRISKVGRSCIMLLATLLSFSAIGLMAADHLFRPNTFVVDQLKIKGRFINLKPQHIENIVHDKMIGNFFAIELDQIKVSIEAIDWVQNADVRREWPNSLSVHVTEHTPVMRWNKDQWLNSQGEVISLPHVALDGSVHLIGNPKEAKRMLHRAYEWQKTLKKQGLELVTLALSDSYAWRLELRDEMNNQFNLILGSDDVMARFERFQMVYNTQIKQSNLQLRRIDARYPDGLAIKAVERPQTELALANET